MLPISAPFQINNSLFELNDELNNISNMNNNEYWLERADTTSLLPPELELESRILETKDYEILKAKKITDKYFDLKKQLKEYKKDANECEDIYSDYLNNKKAFCTSILNLTNSISKMQTLLSSIDFQNQLNNPNSIKKQNDNIKNNLFEDNNEKLDNIDNINFKHTKEYIEYLQNINKKINNCDFNLLQKINEETSKLNRNCLNIQDKMKIIKNMIDISIKETLNDEEENELKVDSKTCPICFENEVNYCFNPCGHLICHNCSEQIRNNKCSTCRQVYNSKIKVFFNI